MNRKLLLLRAGSALLAASTMIATMSATSVSWGSGYLSARFGADQGTPAMANPYAIYYNPAALGGTHGTLLVIDASFIYRSFSYTRGADALSPTNDASRSDPNYVAANTGKGSLGNVLALPFIGASSDLGTKDFRIGFASYVPFGGSTEWKKSDVWAGNAKVPGAVDGPQRWHNITGSTLSLYNTLAAAYRIEPWRLSVGANVSVVYNSIKTVRARDLQGGDDIRRSDGSLLEGRSLLEVSAVNFAAALGVWWNPTDEVRLGASYTIKPGMGEMRLKGTVTQQFGNIAAQAQPDEVDLLQTYPDVVRLGGAFRVNKQIELRLDSQWVRWSAFKNQCVVKRDKDCSVDAAGNGGGDVILNLPRDWRDSVGARAGVGYFVNDTLEVFGSTAISTSPVPNSTLDPSGYDSFRVYLTAGARFAVTEKITVGASYNHIFFANLDTTGKSRLATYGAASKSPSAAGQYKAWIGFLNANVEVRF